MKILQSFTKSTIFFERFLFPSPRFLSLLKHNRERENRWISRETRYEFLSTIGLIKKKETTTGKVNDSGAL